MLCAVFAQAQNEYLIEGKVKGLKEGTVFTLFRQDGRVGNSIAQDTVRNETFCFKEKVAGEEVDKLSLYCTSEGFPSISLELYAAPNAKIKITGANNLLRTWKAASVRHPIPWHNLNDLKQMAGLYAKLDIDSIPCYVLVSP